MIFIAKKKTVVVSGINRQPCEESFKNILIVNVLTSTAIIVTGSVINYIMWKRNAGLKHYYVIFAFSASFPVVTLRINRVFTSPVN